MADKWHLSSGSTVDFLKEEFMFKAIITFNLISFAQQSFIPPWVVFLVMLSLPEEMLIDLHYPQDQVQNTWFTWPCIIWPEPPEPASFPPSFSLLHYPSILYSPAILRVDFPYTCAFFHGIPFPTFWLLFILYLRDNKLKVLIRLWTPWRQNYTTVKFR